MKSVLRFKWLLFKVKHRRHTSQADARRALDYLLDSPPHDKNTQLLDRCLAVLHPEIEDPGYVMPGQEKVLENVRDYFRSSEEELIRQGNAIPQRQADTTQRRRYRPVLIVAIVMLSILIMGTAIAYALGYPLWNFVFHWGEEQLQIAIEIPTPSGTSEPAVSKQYAGVGRGDAFDQKLEELQMDPPLPQLPREYTLAGLDSSIGETLCSVVGLYSFGDKTVHVNVMKMYDAKINAEVAIEKDNKEYETIEMNGINYHFFSNLDTSEVAWVSPPYVVQIGGNLTKEELQSIIEH